MRCRSRNFECWLSGDSVQRHSLAEAGHVIRALDNRVSSCMRPAGRASVSKVGSSMDAETGASSMTVFYVSWGGKDIMRQKRNKQRPEVPFRLSDFSRPLLFQDGIISMME